MSMLDGRVALITGAAGGIGTATARRFAREGARLLLADVDGAAAKKLADELGGEAVQADVTRASDITAMIDAAYRRWGRLDVLFNNAGVIRVQPLFDVTEAEWDRVLDVNLRAVFFVLQATAKRMLRQEPLPGSSIRGKLVQTASIAGFRGGLPYTAHYSASKAAVISITRTAATALAASGITSNCVCPGVVDTAMWKQLDLDWVEIEG